jgi:hypothetical protein
VGRRAHFGKVGRLPDLELRETRNYGQVRIVVRRVGVLGGDLEVQVDADVESAWS